VEREKTLRLAPTPAEGLIWSRLRSAQLGFKFRRQHEMLGYIVDFVCVERRLIVELDGSQHMDQASYDEVRTRAFSALGFRALRFWNNDVLERTDDVLESICAALAEAPPPHPNPLPRQRRGRGSRDSSAGRTPILKFSPNVEPGTSVERSASLGHCARVERSVSVGYSTDTKLPLPQASLGERVGVRGEPGGLRNALELRASLYTRIRRFFTERNVLEVETPVMSASANTDPNIESFGTHFSGHVDAGARERWLRTSSEFAQKRLLVAGVGDCYELGRVFRNGEVGRWHNPEFTMLEWYRIGWDHRRLMDETVDLVRAALGSIGRTADVCMSTYRDLFAGIVGLDPMSADDAQLRDGLREVHVGDEGLTRDDRLDLLLTHRIQPGFPANRITVVYDYPASQCALA
jgi:lysyl-tRNA synthetase class 2